MSVANRCFLVGGLLVLASCGVGGDGNTPSSPPDPNAVSGVAITAPSTSLIIGRTVALSAQAVNYSGTALTGKTFSWGSSSNGVATVRSDGLVTGVSAGTAVITATAEGKVGSASMTVAAQVPTSLLIVSGNGQSGSVATFVGPKDSGVRVLDATGTGISGITVTFIASNGGSVGAATVVTDASGDALVRWQLGPLPTQQSLKAAAGSLTATLTASAQARLTIAAGNDQSATAGAFVGPRDPNVFLLKLDGSPDAGATVTFTPSGNGVVSAPAVVVSSAGDAPTRWRLGTTPGINTLTARAGDSVVTVTAQGLAPVVATSLLVISGSGQGGSIASFIGPKDPTVRVLDANGAGVPGVTVSFTPLNGGAVSAGTVVTNANGDAIVGWQLGPLPMQQTLRATAGSSTATLSASANAKFVIVAGNNKTALAGGVVSPNPTVALMTLNGNAVVGAGISYTPSGDGTVINRVAFTDANGQSGAQWKLSTTPGANALVVQAGDSILTFNAQGTSAPTRSWSRQVSGTTQNLLGVWGTSASDVWAVGENGTIVHSTDGASWAGVPSGATQALRSIWGSSANAAWGVGDTVPGATLHRVVRYTGSWSTVVAAGSQTTLAGVWGSSASDVWAVGGKSQGGIQTILHFNGSTWSTVAGPSTEYLTGVWGSSATDVWAVGESGTIIHYDGGSWSVALNTGRTLSSVWGSSARDVWAVGGAGALFHSNGTTWSSQSVGSANLNSVFGSSSIDIWAVGDAALHYDGVSWVSVPTGTTAVLSGVWAVNGSAWAVGRGGTILRY
jgi:hypothetical protein